MIVTDLFESTTGSSEDTAKQVYQHMIRKIPEFMYTVATADVKKAISKAMSFGPQISVPDLATYAYGILKTKDLDEAYPLGYSTDPAQSKWYDEGRDAVKYGTIGDTVKEIAKKHYVPSEWLEAFTAGFRQQEEWSREGSAPGFPGGQSNRGIRESSEDNPVANAITRRILTQRTDLLAKYGPVKVMNAIDDVADFVGDVEEIGSSDVSGWIRQIEQSLSSMGSDLAEGWRDFFGSKSAAAAPGSTSTGSLSPTFSALIPNPATNKPYTNAELRALANNQVEPTLEPTLEPALGPTADTAPNPFGQMANQLQNYKTSTGGQVRGTATGLKHTASPDNPNAVSTAADSTSNPFGKIANQLQNYTTSTGGQVKGTATGLRNTANTNSTTTMPAAAPAAAPPAGGEAPASPAVDQASKVGVGQINKIIPTLRTRDLNSVKKTVDATLVKKQKQPAAPAAPAARPNFAPQNAGYKSVSYAPNVKTGASMPKPLGVPAPVARSATKVTSGGPTSDEKAKLAQRIAQAVKEPVAEMLQMVETKEDVQRIKKFIDDTFVKHGAVNESAFVVRNKILEHVTQVGAQRRRDFAAQQAQ